MQYYTNSIEYQYEEIRNYTTMQSICILIFLSNYSTTSFRPSSKASNRQLKINDVSYEQLIVQMLTEISLNTCMCVLCVSAYVRIGLKRLKRRTWDIDAEKIRLSFTNHKPGMDYAENSLAGWQFTTSFFKSCVLCRVMFQLTKCPFSSVRRQTYSSMTLMRLSQRSHLNKRRSSVHPPPWETT